MKLILLNGYNIDGQTEFELVDDGVSFGTHGEQKPDGTVYSGYVREDGPRFDLWAHTCGITYLDVIGEYLKPEDWALDQTS